MSKKSLQALLMIGAAFAFQLQMAAQEAPAQEAPAQEAAAAELAPQEPVPQAVADGGTEAVQEAQETDVQEEPAKSAVELLQNVMQKKNWDEGWDDAKKRFITIGSAIFKSTNPATQKDFQVRRRFAAKEAALLAKQNIISFILNEMEAEDKLITPGTDLNKELNFDVETAMNNVAAQKEVLAQLLEKVNKSEAEVLRGTTFGDRCNDMMAAAIKKLDKEYDKDARDKAAKAKYDAVVKAFQAEKARYEELVKKAEALKGREVGKQTSMVKAMSAMPLFGATVMLQTESWDKSTGDYQVAVMMVWSNTLERASRAIVTGEPFTVKPKPSAGTVQQWLRNQDLAMMVGPRTFLDKDGQRWFLGVAAETQSPRLHARIRQQNQQRARLFAMQEAVYSVSADVKAQEAAADAMSVREGKNEAGEQDFNEITASSFAQNLSQKAKMMIRGGQVLIRKTVTHPVTNDKIYVVVYGYNPNSVKAAMHMYTRNYATKVQAERYQTVERGRVKAAKDAVEKAKNRPEDFRKGYNQQSGAIKKELRRRAPKKPRGQRIINKGSAPQVAPKQATSGVFGGDVDVDDDF